MGVSKRRIWMVQASLSSSHSMRARSMLKPCGLPSVPSKIEGRVGRGKGYGAIGFPRVPFGAPVAWMLRQCFLDALRRERRMAQARAGELGNRVADRRRHQWGGHLPDAGR